ncbi:acetamidase/formamidase family protein [bacterium]|nr:acetamidase/formamidase family protein [bacterium]
MDRATFFGCFGFGAAVLPSLALTAGQQASGGVFSGLGQARTFAGDNLSGVRVLGQDNSFTVFKAGLTPAYRVALGELVLIEASHGMPGLVTREGQFLKSQPGDKTNPATGPVFIEGIGPGDALAMDILDLRVGDWGYSGGKVYEIQGGYLVLEPGLHLPLWPMLGVVGVAPAAGEMDTATPGDCGGNMDCREVRAGSTLVLNAQVEGALLGVGDGHAAQGDGEIRGQGIETDTRTLCRFRKLPQRLSERPVILRQEMVATLGAHVDLNEAAWQATDDMVALLRQVTGREEEVARQLVNVLGELKITQIVDPAKGARMELPSWVFGV